MSKIDCLYPHLCSRSEYAPCSSWLYPLSSIQLISNHDWSLFRFLSLPQLLLYRIDWVLPSAILQFAHAKLQALHSRFHVRAYVEAIEIKPEYDISLGLLKRNTEPEKQFSMSIFHQVEIVNAKRRTSSQKWMSNVS